MIINSLTVISCQKTKGQRRRNEADFFSVVSFIIIHLNQFVNRKMDIIMNFCRLFIYFL